MLRTFNEFARFLGNYRYYRRRGIQSQYAWQLAKMTMPE